MKKYILIVLIAMISKSFVVFAGSKKFEFKKSDTISIIGNGLADRMQHNGWLETYLQIANPHKDLAFRNMSLSGDRVNVYPRSSYFTPMDKYLKHVKSNVIFAFFGYNESFKGEKGINNFKNQLNKMISNFKSKKFDGANPPRIVLFSPISHENLKSPDFPDGSENNARLALYTQAMKEVAQSKNVTFVNLFNHTLNLYNSNKTKNYFTINGIHLNNRGNKEIAKIITKELCPEKNLEEINFNDKIKSVNSAVLDKNWYWHNRYRAVDGNDIWGTRGNLKFVNNQSNKEVLNHELLILDKLTSNRDKVIWARVKGDKSYKADDNNVPKAIKVISNVGGKSKSSNAIKEGSLNYLSAEESIKKLKLRPGFKANVFADESRFPELANPVQMQVDSKGRLWAAAWKTYPKWEPFKEMNDALLIFPDDNNDGVADRCITFAKVHNPLGFEFWNGGVIVTSQPDILFLKDTDGDDIADVRYVLFQGIGSSDSHHSANTLRYGTDGGIYWQSGTFLQNNYESPYNESIITSLSGMFRFNPRTYQISIIAKNSPNPHGTSFDKWGYLYAGDGTMGNSYQVRPYKQGFKMHKLINREVRPITSNVIIGSSNFPDEMQGDILIANVIGYLGIKRYKLHKNGYKDLIKTSKKQQIIDEKEVSFNIGEIWGTPTKDFLVSSDKNFRPTDMVFGKKGALYVSDWQNMIIGHMQHNIRDPNRDKKHGRIFRLVYTKKPLHKEVKIEDQSISKLLKNFQSPELHVRHRTRVELSERDSKKVIKQAKKLASKLDPNKKEDIIPLLEVLWLHQQHNVVNRDLLKLVLSSSEPHAVNAAKTVKHFWDNVNLFNNNIANLEKKKKDKIKIPDHIKNDKKLSKSYKLGSKVFNKEAHCVTCHQKNGKGIKNIYPSLVNSAWVTGNPDRLIKLTLHGLYGDIVVNGEKFGPSKGTPPMTPFKDLISNNKEFSSVLNYIRNSWGNKGSLISPDMVKKVREKTKSRSTFYSPSELLKEHPIEEK